MNERNISEYHQIYSLVYTSVLQRVYSEDELRNLSCRMSRADEKTWRKLSGHSVLDK